ncbi:MAG: ADP-dependent NAD(P)H-hydrate dehydratase, partial [Lutibacter sp.]
PKELERLIGKWKNDFEKIEKIKAFSKKHNCIVVNKDAITAVIYKDECYFNSTGNVALATGGSGDTLTGIITGLMAQHYTPLNAAILGVYLHGLTADIGIVELGIEGFTATNIIDYLPDAFLNLLKKPDKNNGQ